MFKNFMQRFGIVLSLILRLYLIPFTIFKTIDAPGDVSFIPYQLWIVPNLIASLFPSYVSGAGVPIGAVLGDLTLLALIVISILIRTPDLKHLGLGKKSNGYYWKPGKIPLWPIVLYFAIAVPAAYSFAYEDTDFYTGRFNATLAGSSSKDKTSVTVFYTHKNHFIRDVRVLAIVFEDFSGCRFEVVMDELEAKAPIASGTYVSRTPDRKTLFADFSNPREKGRCNAVTFRATSPSAMTLSMADGSKYLLERNMENTKSQDLVWASEKFNNHMQFTVSDYRETD